MAQQWKHGWIPLTPGAVRAKNHGKAPGKGSKLGKQMAALKKNSGSKRRSNSGTASSRAEARNQRIIAAAGGSDPRPRGRSSFSGRRPFTSAAGDPEEARARRQVAEDARQRDEESGAARYIEASRERRRASSAAYDAQSDYRRAQDAEESARRDNPSGALPPYIQRNLKRAKAKAEETKVKLDAAERELADAGAWRDSKEAMKGLGLKGTLTAPRDLKVGDTFKLGGTGAEVTVLAKPRDMSVPDTSTGNGAAVWARREDNGKEGWLPIKGTQPQVVTGRKDIEPVAPPADKDPAARTRAASGTSRRDKLRRG